MRLLLVLAAVLLTAAGQAPQVFDATTVGGPVSNKPAELFAPDGAGPFPAMVVLHGCDGVAPHYRDWARRLRSWGYVALLVDSFRPRGFTNVCDHGMQVPPDLQAADGFAAAQWLRTRPTVKADRIGIIGFSHGGWAVLKAVLAGEGMPPFAAAVAFYPGCDPPRTPLATDTLILIGDADDWTPVARCVRWRDMVQRDGHVLGMTIYPDVRHAFDSGAKLHEYMGHYVGGDPAAAADAIQRARDFLAERLIP